MSTKIENDMDTGLVWGWTCLGFGVDGVKLAPPRIPKYCNDWGRRYYIASWEDIDLVDEPTQTETCLQIPKP